MSGRRYRLLIVDDDEALTDLLVEYFGRFGHELLTAPNAAEGRRLLRSASPDLVILDVMLPDADGMDLCRELRAASAIPIVMLTARGDLPDRVLGLELGADDYVAKPFEPRELVARVETLMRRARPAPGRRVTAGGVALDPGTRRVTVRGDDVDLTAAEFELLRALMEGRGRVLSRTALVRTLHGIETGVYDRSVDMLVSRLRRKLGDDASRPRLIKTVRNAGYQFVDGTDA